MRRRRIAFGSAEPAIGTAVGGLRQGRERAAARFVADRALGINQRASALALVHHIDDAGLSDDGALRRHRFMQHQALLAMHDLGPGDAEIRLAQPIGRIALHQRVGRQHFEIFFVDESEFVGVERVLAESEAERVEHAIPWAVAVLDRRDFQRHELIGIQRHCGYLAGLPTTSTSTPHVARLNSLTTIAGNLARARLRCRGQRLY